MSTKIRNNESPGISKSYTGITTNAYVNAISWICSGYSDKLIMLYNSSISYSLTYRILLYAYEDSVVGYTMVSDTVLTSTSTSMIDLHKTYAKVVVQVKSTVPGNHATYQIDYAGVN